MMQCPLPLAFENEVGPGGFDFPDAVSVGHVEHGATIYLNMHGPVNCTADFIRILAPAIVKTFQDQNLKIDF